MLVPHTPRTSLSIPSKPHARHASFLDLPAELRLQIYALALSNIQSCPLHIRKYRNNQWRLRYKKNRAFPTLLLACKQVLSEATDMLFSQECRPQITIDHLREGLTEEALMQECNAYGLWPIEAVVPILRNAVGFTLMVNVPNGQTDGYREQVLSIAVLRWIRALVNSRSATAAPRLVEVIFLSGNETSKPQPGTGLFEATRGFKTDELRACFVCKEWWNTYGRPIAGPRPCKIVRKSKLNSPAMSALLPGEGEQMYVPAAEVGESLPGESAEDAWDAVMTAGKRTETATGRAGSFCRFYGVKFFCTTLSGR